MTTPHIVIGDTPRPEWNRKAYDRARPAGSRKGDRRAQNDRAYLNRRFIAVDGEGINVRTGPRKGAHDYVMLAVSHHAPLIVEPGTFGKIGGLKTIDILDYLWNNLSPKDINVIYGGSYDFNCWLADLIEDEVREIYNSKYDGKPVMYMGYGLRWQRGKAFVISKDDKVVTINDVISFFQRPFIAACDEYLGEYEGRDVLVREKARRGDFRMSELTAIGKYNNLELDLLVRLCEELRMRLFKVGLRPKRWNSPGAIAAALFQRENIKDHRNEHLPAAVQQAARFAYAGGRFEMIKYGSVYERAYEYDINSAYPRALAEVPSLRGGEWVHWKRGDGPMPESAFAMYHVRYKNDDAADARIPGPIFHRAENGTISYPMYSANWVWSPEYAMLQKYCEQVDGASMFTIEAWLYFPKDDYKPFGFIPELFEKRRKLKAAKDGAHVGIKLALNSMYGKTAQQVGWSIGKRGELRIPTYHQLEWAGYVTSWCRAHVLEAAMKKPHAIIAFETDALFTSEPLDLDIGEGLGQWEETVFTSLTYVQSGHYYGTEIKKNGELKEIVKCRGVDRGFISREMVEERLTLPEVDRVLPAPLTRFYGAGIALARDFPNVWRHWITETKTLQLRPTGKRQHGACWCDGSGFEGSVAGVAWHNTYCPVFGSHSHEYPVEWINPNPAMTELAEFREAENYYDD